MDAIIAQVNTSPETVDWKALSSMKLTNTDYYNYLHLVSRNQDKPWDWKIISESIKNIDHLENLNVLIECPLNWKIISENMNKIIKRRVISLDDLPEGYFIIDYFEEFLKYADLFPWNFTILTKGLPKERIDKLAMKIYGYTK
jgi:hypothetical protein